MNDLISRQQALKEMWKALYEYEDKTEKQFQESKDLDVRDWIMNDRLWVQNGHNLCVNVLANLPLAKPERKKGRWLPDNNCYYETRYICSECKLPFHVETIMMKPSWRFCPNCGARMEGEANERYDLQTGCD